MDKKIFLLLIYSKTHLQHLDFIDLKGYYVHFNLNSFFLIHEYLF